MKRTTALLAAAVTPFLFMAAYLTFSRWPDPWFTQTSDFVALGIAVLLGAAFLWRVTNRASSKVGMLVLVSLFLAFLLTGFSFAFVCGLFGDCL